MLNQLTNALDFHGQALSLRSERQRLIASNIANADTPGYVSRDFNFAQALRDATGARSEPNLLYASASQTNLDRNTVDMDRERASFADNSIKYESTLRFINASVRTLSDAMKSPNQG